MKIAVAVLSYNRQALLQRTLLSLCPSVPVVYDNGSTDGTGEYVRSIGGTVNSGGNHTTGHGMNAVITLALAEKPDIVLFTADDFVYRDGWLEKLTDFWEHAPYGVVMASCYLEPHWAWNEVDEVGNAGEQHYAVRTSIPGSNWSFPAAAWDLIGPLSEKTGGEDLEVCHRLRMQGYKLAALDLVEHIGEKESAWGNQSWISAKPFDYKKYGFKE